LIFNDKYFIQIEYKPEDYNVREDFNVVVQLHGTYRTQQRARSLIEKFLNYGNNKYQDAEAMQEITDEYISKQEKEEIGFTTSNQTSENVSFINRTCKKLHIFHTFV
jgi:hypothetical protein